MASFLTAAAAAIGSSNIGSAIVRILVAYGVSRLINKATGNTNTPSAVDQGIRLQVAPDTTNPIPIVYGSAYLGGKITDAQLVDSNKTMWYCLTLSEVPTTTTLRLSDGATITTTVDEIYWNNQRVYFKADGITIDYLVNQDGVVDTSPRDLVKIYLYNGAANAIRPSDLLNYLPSLPTLHGDARTLMPGWVSDERMVGLTFALVKISYNRDKGITGLPDLQFKVSNNLFKPGDAIYAFLRNKISGAGLAISQIDTASLVALNGYADDTISYYDEADGATKTLANRYQINGVINPSDNVMNNLQRLAGNAGCFVGYDIATGLWGVTINKDESAVLAFDDSNIISGIDLTGTNLDSMYNAVEVEFPHRELRDQMDMIRIDLPTEYRNANEPDNILQLKLDLINEPLQARELGYLELYQNRMDQIVTFTTDYSKINTEAGDVITITTDVYGWTLKPFRVVRVREIESDSGGLAVEITAQEYDSTMYTAGGVPRRPRVPSEAIAIPDISVVGTPAAPTVAEFNKVAVPALDITGVTPAGIVDRFEYWYSSDAGTTYKVLGSRSNSNGSPYAQGTSLTFRAASLPAGSYLFKVRGGNEKAFGDFSATVAKTWAPVQVTDQVTDKTTIDTPSLGDLLPVLGMGAIAYFAYKAFAPQALAALSQTDLGKLLGIVDPAEIAAAQAALEQQAAAFRIINAGNVSFSAGVDDTLTFLAGAGISITANDIGHEITISATGETTAGVSKIIAGTGITIAPTTGVGDVTISVSGSSGGGGGGGPVDTGGYTTGSSILSGSVFPCRYTVNSGSTNKTAIFTHGNIVFANSAYGEVIKASNVVTPNTILTPSVTSSDSSTPVLYYTTCTYNSGVGLQAQAWGPWIKWIPPTTTYQRVIAGYSNPPPTSAPSITYTVDGEYVPGGTAIRSPDEAAVDYDVFIPNVPYYTEKAVVQTYQKVKVAAGELVAFGVCNSNLGDTVAFNTNTIFGIQTATYYTSSGAGYPFTGTTSVTNGSIYVSPDPVKVDKMYWSNNSTTWNKVYSVVFQGTSATDVNFTGLFKLLPYNSAIGKFIAYRDLNINYTQNPNNVAYSTNGKDWFESGTRFYPESGGSVGTYANMTFRSNNTSGDYIAFSASTTYSQYGYRPQYSTDGLNWQRLPTALASNFFDDTNNQYGYAAPSYMYPVPGSSRWVIGLKYFTLTGSSVSSYTVNSGVQTAEQYFETAGAAKGRPSSVGVTATRVTTTDLTVIPISSTSFYVKAIGINTWTATYQGVVTSKVVDPLGTIYGTYTISGNAVTASSLSTTYVAPPAEPAGSVTTLASGVTRTTNYDLPIAYATQYYYPGVSGTPAIYRTGVYGIGATVSSVAYQVTYGT